MVTDSQNMMDITPALGRQSDRKRLRGRNVCVESRILRKARQEEAEDSEPEEWSEELLRRCGWAGARLGRRPLIKVKAHQADNLDDMAMQLRPEGLEPNVFCVL